MSKVRSKVRKKKETWVQKYVRDHKAEMEKMDDTIELLKVVVNVSSPVQPSLPKFMGEELEMGVASIG